MVIPSIEKVVAVRRDARSIGALAHLLANDGQTNSSQIMSGLERFAEIWRKAARSELEPSSISFFFASWSHFDAIGRARDWFGCDVLEVDGGRGDEW